MYLAAGQVLAVFAFGMRYGLRVDQKHLVAHAHVLLQHGQYVAAQQMQQVKVRFGSIADLLDQGIVEGFDGWRRVEIACVVEDQIFVGFAERSAEAKQFT